MQWQAGDRARAVRAPDTPRSLPVFARPRESARRAALSSRHPQTRVALSIRLNRCARAADRNPHNGRETLVCHFPSRATPAIEPPRRPSDDTRKSSAGESRLFFHAGGRGFRRSRPIPQTSSRTRSSLAGAVPAEAPNRRVRALCRVRSSCVQYYADSSAKPIRLSPNALHPNGGIERRAVANGDGRSADALDRGDVRVRQCARGICCERRVELILRFSGATSPRPRNRRPEAAESIRHREHPRSLLHRTLLR